MPSLQAAVDNLKGYAFFLDADMVGICSVPHDAWRASPIQGHTHALAVLVAHRRQIRLAEPGFDWIAGSQQVAADMRAMEVATVLARYIGTLGHAATAHTTAESDVDLHHVALEAGLVEVGKDGLTNPLLRSGYGLAVVTTSFDLPADQALAPRSSLENVKIQSAYSIGLGGTRARWRKLDGQDRPWHLGKYPMEKIQRRDETTTLIIDEEVQRVPARQNFFRRAGAGDLGPRPMKEVRRFIAKAPHGLASADMLGRLSQLRDGETAEKQAPGCEDPDRNRDAVKALGHFLGADMTGVCEAPLHAWYSHRGDGSEIVPCHKNAIVFVLDQGYETMEGASGDDWISGAQSMRAYLRAAIIASTLAAHLRRLGFSARSYSSVTDDLNHIPLLLRAGIGELSRIGELVLNPFVGPRFKSGVVTTDFPMTPDRPIDFGLQDFCSKCNKCARECPVDAIRFGEKTMFNGYEMWKPDVQRCASYRTTNQRGSACGRCMKTCPYNAEGVLAERPFQWAAIKLPFARSWIARLDDKVRNGSINPLKKWWVDIEVIDGQPVEPPKGANRRELSLEAKVRKDDSFAMFPPEIAPGADQAGTFPIDRKAGLDAARNAETPAEARRRIKS